MGIVVCKFYENTLIFVCPIKCTVYREILRRFTFVNFANFKVSQKFINAINNYARVSCMCTRGNQLNGHGQEAG